jgi:hypothetical protein
VTNPADGKSRIMPIEAFAGVIEEKDAPKFLADYPHPFLILETKEGDFGEAGFQTVATGGSDADKDAKNGAAKSESKSDLTKTVANEDGDEGTDFDIQTKAKPSVAEKHEEVKKKLDEAARVTYVCPLVKRDVNKFASMITLGRAANNDIRLNLPSISKFHAYFTHVQSNNTWYVADANSSNGTFVNGERLKSDRNRLKLENGAAIRLGTDVTMRFFESKSFYEFLLTRLGGGSKNA